jgi:hypothetical protein
MSLRCTKWIVWEDAATSINRSLAIAAACLVVIAAGQAEARRTVVVKHPPVVSQGDVPEPQDAQQNVIESKQYERLLRTNPGFRQARMRKECGPITDPQLHQSCVASFERYAGP